MAWTQQTSHFSIRGCLGLRAAHQESRPHLSVLTSPPRGHRLVAAWEGMAIEVPSGAFPPMSTDRTSNAWIEIGPGSLNAAADVLALAFENDPLMRYVFSGSATYSVHVREAFRFVCEARLELGWPLIGTTSDSGLTGVACLSPPEERVWPASLVKKYDRLQSSLGYESFNRLGRFSRLSRKHAPAQGHYYLAAIGVHPEFQGRGLSRVLLDGVKEMSESHAASTGVYLETALQENVTLYEHFGYQVIAKDKLDAAVELWYMFRPNKSSNGSP